MYKNNILIIGNGFDLAHKLPTKYINFLDFMLYIEQVKNNRNDPKLEYIKNILNSVDFNIEKSEEIYLKSKKNIWINYFKKIREVKKEKLGENWIDLELEISNVIKSLDLLKYINEENIDRKDKDIKMYDNKYCDTYYDFFTLYANDYNLINNFKYQDAKKVIESINKDLIDFIELFEIYLSDVIEKIEINERLIDLKDIEFCKILSFNYTNTFNRIYDKNNNCDYDYIHGKVNNSKNNLILGIDEYLDEDKKNIKLDFIMFKKYFQRIYKKSVCKYKEWIDTTKKVNYEIYDLYIYGHSLDITDKDILCDLILSERIKQITIFYLDDYDYAQKIANMIRLIGQDELIKRLYGLNKNIIFKEISK